MMSWCIGWGPNPTWNGSHLHFKDIQGVWEHSFAVDGVWEHSYAEDRQMDTWSSHFHYTRQFTFVQDGRNFGDDSSATNDVMVHWLRPQSHMEWFPPPLLRYTRCLRTFICCGWTDGSTIMPLPPYVPCVEIREFTNFLGHSLATNDVMVHWLRPQTHIAQLQIKH